MLDEEWKNAPELRFSNYLFSNLGNVFNISCNKMLKGSIKTGYILYQLINDEGKNKKVRSNIFVSELFSKDALNLLNDNFYNFTIIIKIPIY